MIARAAARTLAACVVALVALVARDAGAQVVPNADWRTLETPHFWVHYTRDLDSLARRAAVSAERAYGRLARELAPPRAPLDLVVADNVDYSNGFATTFPTNRIVVYATPPVEGALRNYADWLDLVVTHELTHVFHLDRSRGIWRLGQRVFGRNPALFPNGYSPSWLTEGLAVYYETRLTGSGRLAGTAHRVQALAAAAGGASPRLDQLSAATPAFPGGSSAYVWGSLAVEQLAASSDSQGVRRFVDAMAGQLIPFRLNHAARRAFGRSLSAAWAGWRDSVEKEARSLRTDSAWRFVGGPAWDASAPRWTASGTTAAWPATFPREVPALWLADTAGRLHRLGRRNTLDVNSPRGNGGYVFGQLDFVDPFRVRADLWVVDADGDRRRLTRGARLVQPDVRADGTIAAVQIVGGTTRLVRLSEADTRIVALTTTHPDTQWSEPRWGGASGRELAAVRRMRGGRAEVVRIDTNGVATVVSASDRVEASPSWDGTPACALWSVSDRSGQPLPLLSTAPCDHAGEVVTALLGVAPGTAGIVALDANRPRAGAERGPGLAAVAIGARGYRLLMLPPVTPTHAVEMAARVDTLAPARAALADTSGQGASSAPSRGYSPWRSLVPRWWLPLTGTTSIGTTMLGGYSSGSDIVGRHLWSAQALVPVRHPEEVEGAVTWRYRGFGQPAIDFGLVQEWLRDTIRVQDPETGSLQRVRVARAERTASLGLTLVRPRIYTSASLSFGGEIEWFDPLRTEPRTVAGQINPTLFVRRSRPGVYVAGAWSALQRAPQAVSAEDGVSVGATYRERWQRDFNRDNGRWAIGTLRAYKSIPLPGYAKHVLATRVSGGWANVASTSDYFEAGGTSGSSLEVLPGVTVGDASRSFGVRGFGAGTLAGNRAVGGALEYRAPLLLANRGLGLSPLYLARTGITLFGEGATAWCGERSALFACRAGPHWQKPLASAGGELWLDASASYDVPYRVRLGVAVPVAERERSLVAGRSLPVQGYVTFGAAF